ncbi:hypothetical protein GCM10009836_67170 [Pseudonocardia ailaonensis]|uniref:YdhG-like domain-containing protein n=1 Tax=Pseudonocardia ailaonensis TaxID=367279 RepID=A0ABN2NN40_9PSEU
MTPDEYLAAVDEPRQADVRALDALIRESAPDLPRFLYGSMLGYGPFHYRYASGREGDAALIALAAQKRHFSVYVACASQGRYLAESYADRLPGASVGKSCVRFTTLAKVDEAVLRELIADAAARGPQEAAGPA